MKGRHLLLGLIALVVLAFAFALGRGGRTPNLARATAPAEQAGLGYIADDVVVQQTDAAGQLQYELQAGEVEQRSDGSPIVARELTLVYEPLDDAGRVIPGRRWTLRADEGRLPEESGLLDLAGNVEVGALLATAAHPLTVRTERLEYDTRSQTLSSRSDVRFIWGRQQLQGRGLTANIRAGTLALESGVHGRFSP